MSKPNEDALVSLLHDYQINTVIEIGAFLGRSTALFAEHCEQVFCIDPFVIWDDFTADMQPRDGLKDDFFDQFWGNMQALGIQDKITPIRLTSWEAARNLPKLEADLIYLDGAHDLESVTEDIALWQGRAHRILCGDDYSERWDGVRQAVDGLGRCHVIGDSIWFKSV